MKIVCQKGHNLVRQKKLTSKYYSQHCFCAVLVNNFIVSDSKYARRRLTSNLAI